MKLIRFGESGKEKPGIILNGWRYEMANYFDDYDENFFTHNGLQELDNVVNTSLSALKKVNGDSRLGPPICRPSKIICVGLNFTDHAKESGMPDPLEPVIFFKSTTAIVGPYDNLVLPKNSHKTDWEVELAVIISKRCSYISENKAMDHVAGFVLHNDFSERQFQLERGGQWVKGKSADTFAPLGPWLATKDEVPDINNLRLWLKVNGQLMQNGNSKDMIFKIPFLIAYLSSFMTLLPGDIISTGTPAGVGLGQKPSPVYIKPGDVIELGIDGLGSSKQTARAFS